MLFVLLFGNLLESGVAVSVSHLEGLHGLSSWRLRPLVDACLVLCSLLEVVGHFFNIAVWLSLVGRHRRHLLVLLWSQFVLIMIVFVWRVS